MEEGLRELGRDMLVHICLDTFINIKHNNTIMHNDFSYQISWLSLVQQYCSMALIKINYLL